MAYTAKGHQPGASSISTQTYCIPMDTFDSYSLNDLDMCRHTVYLVQSDRESQCSCDSFDDSYDSSLESGTSSEADSKDNLDTDAFPEPLELHNLHSNKIITDRYNSIKHTIKNSIRFCSVNSNSSNQTETSTSSTNATSSSTPMSSTSNTTSSTSSSYVLLDYLPEITAKFDALFPFYRLSDADCRALSCYVYDNMDKINKVFCNSRHRSIEVFIYFYDSSKPKTLVFYNKQDREEEVAKWRDIRMNQKYCLRELGYIN